MVLEKPQPVRSNRHCLNFIHRNPEHLTFNLCCAHTFIHGFLLPFIHGFLLPFIYTPGYATDLTSALDMQIALY